MEFVVRYVGRLLVVMGTVGVGVSAVPNISSSLRRVLGRLFVPDAPGTNNEPRGTSEKQFLYKPVET